MSFSIFKFSTIQRSTLPPVDLYEKDGKAQLGNLPSSKFPVSPPVMVVSFPTPLRFVFIFLSLSPWPFLSSSKGKSVPTYRPICLLFSGRTKNIHVLVTQLTSILWSSYIIFTNHLPVVRLLFPVFIFFRVMYAATDKWMNGACSAV